jgi:hypothetical protein
MRGQVRNFQGPGPEGVAYPATLTAHVSHKEASRGANRPCRSPRPGRSPTIVATRSRTRRRESASRAISLSSRKAVQAALRLRYLGSARGGGGGGGLSGGGAEGPEAPTRSRPYF